jgi:hypothetical protein
MSTLTSAGGWVTGLNFLLNSCPQGGSVLACQERKAKTVAQVPRSDRNAESAGESPHRRNKTFARSAERSSRGAGMEHTHCIWPQH